MSYYKRGIRFLISFLILNGIFVHFGWAVEPTAVFETGLQQYQKQDYHGAEQSWNQVLNTFPNDVATLYNQGLNFIQQKRWGMALAFLRQVQLLSPRHLSVEKALDFVEASMKSRGFNSDQTFLATFENSAGKYILLPEILGIHLLLSLAVLLILGQLFRERRRARFQGAPLHRWAPGHLAAVSTWLLFTVVLVLKIAASLNQQATVITSGLVAVRSGPFKEAAQLGDLPEGALIIVRDFYQDWVQIQFGKTPTGWVPRKEVLLLTPDGLK
jgi:tetratricopeptide (TPR) repeat protein